MESVDKKKTTQSGDGQMSHSYNPNAHSSSADNPGETDNLDETGEEEAQEGSFSEMMRDSEGIVEDLQISPTSVPISILSTLLQVPYGSLRGFIERDEVNVDEEADKVSIFLDEDFRKALEDYNPRRSTLVKRDGFSYESLKVSAGFLNSSLEGSVPTLTLRSVAVIYGVPPAYLEKEIRKKQVRLNRDIPEDSDAYEPMYGEVYNTDDVDEAEKRYEDDGREPDHIVLYVTDTVFEYVGDLMNQYKHLSEDIKDKYRPESLSGEGVNFSEKNSADKVQEDESVQGGSNDSLSSEPQEDSSGLVKHKVDEDGYMPPRDDASESSDSASTPSKIAVAVGVVSFVGVLTGVYFSMPLLGTFNVMALIVVIGYEMFS